MRILIIEDEEDFATPLARGLRLEGYCVDVVDNGESGLFQAINASYDLILLDINLPDLDGLTLCKQLRAIKPDILICIISARVKVHQRIDGLDTGADDYITKPIHFQELLARIRALLRRNVDSKKPVLALGKLRLDPRTHEVLVMDKLVPLTAKEYVILEYLLNHPGEVLSQGEIIEHTWGEDAALFSNSIRTHIYSIRKKLKAAGLDNVMISTAVNQGYFIKMSG
ncbi:MAG: response regulator transcription factor [Anaerolineaceae bacterium]